MGTEEQDAESVAETFDAAFEDFYIDLYNETAIRDGRPLATRAEWAREEAIYAAKLARTPRAWWRILWAQIFG